MKPVRQGTSGWHMVLMTDATDRDTGLPNLNITAYMSKDCGAYAQVFPTIIDRGFGQYAVRYLAGDTDTIGELNYHFVASGAGPSDLKCLVYAHDASETHDMVVDMYYETMGDEEVDFHNNRKVVYRGKISENAPVQSMHALDHTVEVVPTYIRKRRL